MEWPGAWRSRGTWAVAVLTWLLVDLWRMWTPSLITVFGRAAETPPELIGLFALAVMATPLLVLLGWRRPGAAAPVLLALLALLMRIAVQPTDGGRPQLVLASLGVVVAVTCLCLAAGRLGDRFVPGLLAGLALSVTTHAAVGTYGAVWRHDLVGWALVAIQLLALVVTVRGLRVADPVGIGARRAWLLMPVLLLVLIAGGNVGRSSAAWPTVGPLVTVAAAVAAAWLAAGTGRPAPTRRTRLVAAVLLVAAVAVLMLVQVTRDGAPGQLPYWSVVAFAVGLPCLAILLVGPATPSTSHAGTVARDAASSPHSVAAPPRDEGRGGGRDALAAAAGGIVFTVLLFAFYAGYDLGYRADWVVVALAAVVTLVLARGEGGGEGDSPRERGDATALTLVLAGALAVAGLGPLVTLRPVAQPSSAGAVVAAWNLRMGYGMDGTFRPVEVAEQIVQSGARVVLLSEVDRGWLLNGGQDQLEVLARLTGMRWVFAPAADQVWGDAILTDLPLRDPVGTTLPAYDSLTGAQVLRAQVRWKGDWFTVVATHLQPDAAGEEPTRRQAEDLDRMVEGIRGPVVVGGDLNTSPEDPVWRELTDHGVSDAFVDRRPVPTSPADAPAEEIDHLLVRGLQVSDGRAVPGVLSDHLMVAVRLP